MMMIETDKLGGVDWRLTGGVLGSLQFRMMLYFSLYFWTPMMAQKQKAKEQQAQQQSLSKYFQRVEDIKCADIQCIHHSTLKM